MHILELRLRSVYIEVQYPYLEISGVRFQQRFEFVQDVQEARLLLFIILLHVSLLV
jgi:hypothetical protein